MADIKQTLNDLGITVESKFVPWTQSRNFDPERHIHKSPSGKESLRVQEGTLNWKVTLKKDGKEILTTDYSAGIGHLPCYQNWDPKTHGCRLSLHHAEFMEHELQTGKACTPDAYAGFVGNQKAILPNPVDVVWSLTLDSTVLDYSTFEDWACDFGYDEDSRKAEQIYKACMEIALKIRNGLGEGTMTKLRELYQDY